MNLAEAIVYQFLSSVQLKKLDEIDSPTKKQRTLTGLRFLLTDLKSKLDKLNKGENPLSDGNHLF